MFSPTNRIDAVISADERARLCSISRDVNYVATLLPIRTVGVQGDGRTYSYAVGISSDHVRDIVKEMVNVCSSLNPSPRNL